MLALAILIGCGGPGAGGATAVGALADVSAVSVSGDPGDYTFAVTLQSPDVDCTQYADWWEVLTEDGQLVFRRILNHSHPDEQPFIRDGGPVPASAEQVLIVRGHLNPSGYGGAAVKGSVSAGFQPAQLSADFAAAVAQEPPQVEACWH